MDAPFTPEELRLVELWERHMHFEFAAKDAAATVETMSEQSWVNHVPVMTGGTRPDEVLAFYRDHFIPKMPADTAIELVSRTVGQARVIDELIFKFTHDLEMDWMLPGVKPTGRRVEVPLVVVVQTGDGAVLFERIYWDQASVLAQIGLLDARTLPIAGIETARKVRDPSLPSNQLIRRVAL